MTLKSLNIWTLNNLGIFHIRASILSQIL